MMQNSMIHNSTCDPPSPGIIETRNNFTFRINCAPGDAFSGTAILVEGWCFACGSKNAPLIKGAVVPHPLDHQPDPVTAALPFEYESTAVSVQRPDVLAIFPNEPGAGRSGFFWTFPIVHNARYDITLWAISPDDIRTTLFNKSVMVLTPDYLAPGRQVSGPIATILDEIARSASHAEFQCHLDAPQGGLILRKSFLFQGWCRRADGQHISAIRVRIGADIYHLQCGQPRKDVAIHFKGRPGTLHSGFAGIIKYPHSPAEAILEAQVANYWAPVRSFTIRRVSPIRFAVSMASTAINGRINPNGAQSASGAVKIVKVLSRIRLAPIIGQTLIPWTVQALQPSVFVPFYQYPPRAVVPEIFPKPSRIPAANLPRCAIVTPSFNQAAFLNQTMESVIHQEGVNIEYIVMDGGSTDGSIDIIRAHARRLAFWVSQKDGGQSAAIACGFKHAGGGADDIMAYLNSDDLLMPGVVRFVAEYFRRHPEIDAVYGHRVIIDPEGHEVGRWYTHRHNAAILRFVDMIPQETLFWRRRIYDRVGGIDPSFWFAMDWDLILRFLGAGARMKRLPYFMACFRVHDSSKTVTQSSAMGAMEVARILHAVHGRHVTQKETGHHWNRAIRESSMLKWLWARGIRW